MRVSVVVDGVSVSGRALDTSSADTRVCHVITGDLWRAPHAVLPAALARGDLVVVALRVYPDSGAAAVASPVPGEPDEAAAAAASSAAVELPAAASALFGVPELRRFDFGARVFAMDVRVGTTPQLRMRPQPGCVYQRASEPFQ